MENIKETYLEKLMDLDRDLKDLTQYCRNLNLLALKDELPSVYGRNKEIDEIKTIMFRRTKPNAILIGTAGAGKTAIVEGLAKSYVKSFLKKPECEVPIIYELSLNALVSGAKYRGSFEERLEQIIKITKLYKNIILFIDEIHSINEIGGSEGATTAGQILKPALARGEIRCIGATTTGEYQKHILTDKALTRRFCTVKVNILKGIEQVKCAENILSDYSNYFKVDTKDVVTEKILNIIEEVSPNTIFPDNFIDIIDTTLAKAKFKNQEKISNKDIKNTISAMYGILII